MENTLNGEKSLHIWHISVNNSTTWKKTLDALFLSLIGLNKPKKPSHATYCPFKPKQAKLVFFNIVFPLIFPEDSDDL